MSKSLYIINIHDNQILYEVINTDSKRNFLFQPEPVADEEDEVDGEIKESEEGSEPQQNGNAQSDDASSETEREGTETEKKNPVKRPAQNKEAGPQKKKNKQEQKLVL